jgi:hypothetical protein
MSKEPRRVKINWADLELAMDQFSGEMHGYLDLETGNVVTITDEVLRYLDDPPDDLPDWQQEELELARQIEEDDGSRFLDVPQSDSHDDYRVMQGFIETVGDAHLQERLWCAIDGRGAFRYFKDVLHEHGEGELERWYSFRDRRQRERLLEWLEAEGVEPTNPPTSDREQD